MTQPSPCSACPWKKENQGTPHPHGWYSRQNLRRLWLKLRNGDSMSCHPTDPNNDVPEGGKEVPEGVETRECVGAMILVQREFTKFQGEPDDYKCRSPNMSKVGLRIIVEREIFGGVFGTRALPKPNLNDLSIQYPPLGEWKERK